MANTPFTPSRSALGDISNHKLFQTSLKTPRVISEEAEKIYGEAMLEIPGEIEIADFDLNNSPLPSPKYYIIQDTAIDQDKGKEYFYEKEFEEIETEIVRFLEIGITYSQDTDL